MLEKPQFNTQGEKIVCTQDTVHPEMLQDIRVYRMKKGQELTFGREDGETAILLTEGTVTFAWNGNTAIGSRKNVFDQPPYCLHICKGMTAKITAEEDDSEILVQSTDNDREFEAHFYTAEECKIELMGAEQWEGTAKREVLTIFDYQNAPYSNMVIGEVITKAGRWSSYVPHSHPQSEVYYYKFDHPQGFGAAFTGDQAFKITDGTALCIPGGLTHPQAAAPGYNMYYCWMIRHLDGNPWTSRDVDPVHAWLLEE